MTRQRKIQSCSIVILSIFAGSTAWAAADPELGALQAEKARAHARYYRELRDKKFTTNEQKDRAFEQIVGPANAKITGLINERKKENDSKIYNKIFFYDGTVMPASQYRPDSSEPSFVNNSASDSGIKTATASGSLGKGSSPASNGSGGVAGNNALPSSPSEGPSHSSPAIDGSGIQKVIEFPGKKKK